MSEAPARDESPDGVELHPALAESGRFAVQACLGSGSFGVVYAAHDSAEGSRVALKWLKNNSPEAIARFKREFRSLADLSHPNLVGFRELFTVGGEWFFTMDLVAGVDLLRWVRAASHASPAPSTAPESAGSTIQLPSSRGAPSSAKVSSPSAPRSDDPRRPRRPLTLADLPRLRATLTQLAAGLSALHAAGMVHRDVKPSNVLVTEDGRVVLLDFGLVTELGRDGLAQTLTGSIVGTPAYMSPEQARGKPLGPATDWYAFGTILYQALTGCVPFDGPATDVLLQKQVALPPHPSSRVQGVPKALGDLCLRLLANDPAERPSGPEVMAAFDAALPPSVRTLELVGRETQLWALEEALDEVERAKTVIALVSGDSGIGKSALLRRFVAGVRRDRPDTVVLEGRCYERESVPYKALDSLVDSLCHYLQRLPPVEVARLLPRDLGALCRLFPVFLQFGGAASRRARARADLVQERRRAAGALRELVGRLADTRPVVLVVDDLQWGDADSEPLFGAILRAPDPPPLLLVAAFRSDAVGSPLVRALARLGDDAGVEVCEIPVGELSDEAARDLASALLDGSPLAAELARESFGSPLFLEQLAGAVRERTEPAPSVDLCTVFRRRIEELPPEARRLLETLAVAGRPLAVVLSARAAGLDDEVPAALAKLRGAALVRSRDDRRESIELFHDRLREAVVRTLSSDELAARHRALARTLASAGDPDAEAIATHFAAGGDPDLGAQYATVAADRAAKALAFDRAASLYEMALELAPEAPVEAPPLVRRLAEALANAGRGKEAAERFLVAARAAGSADGLELVRRAAEQLLFSGHVAEGLELVERMLDRLGMRPPRTRLRAALSLAVRRLFLRLRRLRFRERRADEIPREELARIDACYGLALGLGMVDPIRGADFQARSLLFALRAGEPLRVARALALEAAYRATEGDGARRAVDRLLARAAAIAEKVGQPHAIALARLMAGIARVLQGQFAVGITLCDRAALELAEKCTGVAWEHDNAVLFSCFSLLQCGRIPELRRRTTAALDDARARGDLYAEMTLRLQCCWFVSLAADDVERARADLDSLGEGFPDGEVLLQHVWQTTNEVDVALYAESGVGSRALDVIEPAWARLERSLYLRTAATRARALSARGRAVLAAASALPVARAALLRLATACARELRRLDWAPATGLRLLLEAGVRGVVDDASGAEEKLRAAITVLDVADARLAAASARWVLSKVRAGEDGSALRAAAERAMAEAEVARPERMAALYLPGGWW